MTRSDVKTAAEAAERLGVNRITVERWERDGQLKAIRRGPLLFETVVIEEKAAELAAELRAKLAHLDEAEVAS